MKRAILAFVFSLWATLYTFAAYLETGLIIHALGAIFCLTCAIINLFYAIQLMQNKQNINRG